MLEPESTHKFGFPREGSSDRADTDARFGPQEEGCAWLGGKHYNGSHGRHRTPEAQKRDHVWYTVKGHEARNGRAAASCTRWATGTGCIAGTCQASRTWSFPARRKVIFVHGCFWHQHADPECRIVRTAEIQSRAIGCRSWNGMWRATLKTGRGSKSWDGRSW